MNANETVSAAELAGLLGVSVPTLHGLVQRGIVLQAGKRGRFLLVPSIRNFLAQMKEGSGPKLSTERARLAKATADRAELRLRNDLGDWIEKATAKKVLRDAGRALQTRLMSIPARVRQQCPAVSALDANVIEREIREALTELSDVEGQLSRPPAK